MNVEAAFEDLRTLSDTVPLLAKNVSEALQGAEALEAAAEKLQHDVDAAREEAATHLTALRDALPSLAAQVEGDEKHLTDADKAVTDAWNDAEPALARTGEAVEKRVDDVLAHSHDLSAVLAEAATKIDQSQKVGEEALARLEHDAKDAEQRIHAALQALQTEVGNFKEFVELAKGTLVTTATYLWSQLGTVSAEAEAGAQEAMTAMHTKASEHKDAAQDVFSALADHVGRELGESEDKVEQAVTTPLADVDSQLHGELDRLGAGAGKHEEELAKHGQALHAAMDQVKGEADIVPAGIAQIQEAARQLGI